MPDPIPFRDPYQYPTRSGPPGISLGDTGGIAPDASQQPNTETTLNIGEDGSVEIIETDVPEETGTGGKSDFGENLAEREELAGHLATIAADLLEGIEADERSRNDWVENYNKGLDLLGLKIEGTTSGQSMSSVTHPIMLEAVLHFRALARGEILPADGPAKVRNDGDQTAERNQLADELEADVNHWLTTIAKEYYPDTDRGLIYVGFGGDIFKKVYYCPVRQRPVSECVYLPDLIVSQDATDLTNATRVTHRIEMNKTQMRRLMLAGAYRETMMVDPTPSTSSIDRKEKEVQGIAPTPSRQQDYQRTVYECYADIDLSQWIDEPGQPEELPLPYRVSIDKDSREVLEIRRNWREGDEMFRKRQRFVKWPFMPGMGFYDMGYIHIIGQHARALTALWRIMIDAGMFSNFPGGVKLRGSRTDTNQIRPAPGEFVDVDGGAGVDDIRSVIMAMPYKDVSAVMLDLTKMIEDDARKLAGTVDLEAGEGRTNVPVGTIMAMVEQQTQLLTAVHKGLHAAQQEELILLRELFAEDPESLWRDNPQPTRKWKAEELTDLSFVPASDPNTPAHIHRTMQGYALAMLSQGNPLYNQMAVQKRLLQTLRIADPDELLVQPASSPGGAGAGAGAGGDPSALAAMGMVQNQGVKNMLDAKTKAADLAQKQVKDRMDFQAKIASLTKDWNEKRAELENAAADRESRERIAAMNGQVQLILKGIEQLNQPASPDPVNDDLTGPG